MTNKTERTIGRSFRLNEQWLTILSEEAKEEGISPNAPLNRLLKKYCLLDRHLKTFPAVLIDQNGLSKIIKELPKEKVRILGKQTGLTTFEDIRLTLGELA